MNTTNDPISDLLTRLRNASAVKHQNLVLPYSKIKLSMLEILKDKGYIEDVEVIEKDSDKGIKFNQLKVKLKYINDEPVIHSIKRISKPGQRIYKGKDELPVVLNNYGIAIISTSQGLMTNHQARKNKLGGEVLCEVY